MKPVIISQHARDQMDDRGASESEIEEAVRSGDRAEAGRGLLSFRKNFPYTRDWKGRLFATKQVRPILAEEADRFVVVTVYVYYFGGNE